MKLSPFAQIKLAAVLATASVLLGCEAPSTSAGEQAPPVDPAVSNVAQPNLVSVTNLVAKQPSPDQPGPDSPPVAPVQLSDRLQEVVKLAQSGVSDDVILAFIQNAATAFNPSPDEILYLTDIGLSDVVITALVNHLAGQPQVAEQPAPSAPPPPAAPEEAPPATYNPEPQVVYSAPSAVQYVAPAPTVEYSYFYNSLSPYGSWVDVADYGWCWQPSVAVYHHDWRPYSDRGRWLNTDCGWYWQSDYSWGWAPFHYGRWFHHPARGWCWRPGSTWSPAWVSWRYTDSHCGWAPLPPGAHYDSGVGFTYYGAHVGVSFGFGLHHDAWTFVPAHRFNEREVWRHRVGGGERAALYRQSKVVNNYVFNDNRIINRGVGPERLPALARSEVKKVAIRDLPEGRPGAVRPDRLHQQGAETVLYRPKMPAEVQHSMRALDSGSARTIASTPAGARGGSISSPLVRPRSEPAAPGVSTERPGGIRDVSPGVNHSFGQTPATVGEPRPAVRSQELLARTRQEATPVPDHSVAAPGSRTPAAPSNPSAAPIRSYSPSNPAIQRLRPSNPQAVAEPIPTTRQEPNNPSFTSPQRVRPTTPAATPQTYRVPSQASNPSWNQLNQSGVAAPTPQAVAPPVPTTRQEMPNRGAFVAPEKYSRPAPAYQPTRSEPAPAVRSAPAFSQPAQTRSVPSYSAPAVQARPAPSYSPAPARSAPAPAVSLPASRPAPQAAPAPSQTSRSGNRRE